MYLPLKQRLVAPRRRAVSQSHQAFPFSAPLKGIDVTQPLPNGDPLTAIKLENLIPRVLGCQLRKGYYRWKSNLDGEVRSLMQYHPATGTPELFAATNTGKVYDVTTSTPSSDIPTPVLTLPGGLPPGEWTSINYTTAQGINLLCAVNRGGGYYVYDGLTWEPVLEGAAAGEIAGVSPLLFSTITAHKGRLWFIEAETTRAWYLNAGEFAGTATAFEFGAMLPNGGELAWLASWNYDGGGGSAGGSGAGMDSKLVVIADQGDVLIYAGTDPDLAANWGLEGRWFVGRVPVGHRFASQYGTDLAILSERGLVFLSELLRGQGFFNNTLVAARINSELALQLQDTLAATYWEIVNLPHEQLLIINRPDITGANQQWAFEVNNKAFCTLEGIPMNTVAAFNGATYSGDLLGNIWLCFDGQSDGAIDGVPGLDLQGRCLSAFQAMGEGMRVKRLLMVRASFVSDAPPGVAVKLNRDWDLSLPASAPPYTKQGQNLWDVGTWDTATWAGSGRTYEAWNGASGTGRYAALSMAVRGPAGTVWVGWQAVVEQGGIL